MWMVYALATLLDVNKAPYAVEAHEYYLLSRLALRYAPPAHDTTLIAIQTISIQAEGQFERNSLSVTLPPNVEEALKADRKESPLFCPHWDTNY